MSVKTVRGQVAVLAGSIVLGVALSGCVSGFSSSRTEGYALSESSLKQIRPGQSQALVNAVLGSPQSKGTFGDETAYYYVQTRVDETAFGLRSVKDRKVLAVYFDKNNKVSDKALYGLEDGRFVTIETRRTKSFGQDRTFVESLLFSLTN
jgi:outer membrane protein assembly factor BamE (lipoprotein component of BamABCDE complex)